ncbi:MAG: class II glutamine amidotransferase [Myxococcota bacterium]
MCRFTLHLGAPIRMSALLLDPEHSLIRQSSHSRERDEPLNGDGFGVGWYAPRLGPEPAVFRSITPAWNNRNLRNLARVVASRCILAHVRAATQSSAVNEANCHPFRYGRYLFMHNGDVGNFRKVRRHLLESVRNEAFDNVYGSTDTEHVFALAIDELLRGPRGLDATEAMARALTGAIERVLELVDAHGDGEPSYLNCALANGSSAVVSRFTNDPDEAPESLYLFEGPLYPVAEDEPAAAAASIVVSSERLTSDAGWVEVPANHLVVLRAGEPPRMRPIEARARTAA